MILTGGFSLLMLALVMALGLAGARWFSPKWLRWTAARLMARADAIEESGKVYQRSFEHYHEQLTGEGR